MNTAFAAQGATVHDALLAPISEAAPCGTDLSYSHDFDAIARMREADDPSLDQGAWITPLKVADWPGVAQRCTELLGQRSKDLRLASWLTEAWARTEGYAGLARGLHLTAQLAQRYWSHLHPLPDGGDQEERIGNIAWLLARVQEQTERLTRAQREAPVASSHLAGHISDHLATAREALHGLHALQQVVDLHLGQHGPSFVAAREALSEAVQGIERLARESGAVMDAAGAAIDARGPASEAAIGAEAVPPHAAAQASEDVGAITCRAQALRQLRDVAEYFRHAEPHSPVAYLADQAVRWGNMPLHEWLRTVLKDAGSLSHVETLLGVASGTGTPD